MVAANRSASDELRRAGARARARCGGRGRARAPPRRPPPPRRRRRAPGKPPARSARCPSIVRGEVVVLARRSATDQPSSAVPSTSATPWCSSLAEATSAFPHAASAASIPKATPLATQATVSSPRPENRGPATAPATAPASAPLVSTPRELAEGGGADHEATLDRCEHHVLDVGRLEREGPAVCTRAQPHGHEEGDEQPRDRRTVTGHVGERRGGELPVADDGGQRDEHGDEADADDVGAIERVHPVQVAEPLHPPATVQAAQRVPHLGTVEDRGHCGPTLPARRSGLRLTVTGGP